MFHIQVMHQGFLMTMQLDVLGGCCWSPGDGVECLHIIQRAHLTRACARAHCFPRAIFLLGTETKIILDIRLACWKIWLQTVCKVDLNDICLSLQSGLARLGGCTVLRHPTSVSGLESSSGEGSRQWSITESHGDLR